MNHYQTEPDGLGRRAVLTPPYSDNGGLVVGVGSPWGPQTAAYVRPGEVDAFLDAARVASGRAPERHLGDLPKVETEKWDPETPSRLVYSVQGTPKAYVEHDEPGVADVVASLRREGLAKLAVADRIEADAAKRRERLARRLERRRGEISKAAEELDAEIDWQRGRRAAKAHAKAMREHDESSDEALAAVMFSVEHPGEDWPGPEYPKNVLRGLYLPLARAARRAGYTRPSESITPKKEA